MDMALKSKYIEAILHLARINDYEPGFNPNPQKAFYWYKTAAELGSPYAQYCVGTCYADGHSVLKDDVEAFRWFLRAAQQKPPGFSVAQHAVGICCEQGKGAPQDNSEAIRWFRKAAEQGLAVAQCALADCHRLGKGTPKDFPAAASWYEKAAEQGHAIAQNNLGICYERGMGVSQDMLQAYTWLRLAADGGLENAKKAATDVAALMSSSEFETARRLYRGFKAKRCVDKVCHKALATLSEDLAFDTMFAIENENDIKSDRASH